MNERTQKENENALLEYMEQEEVSHPKKLTICLPNSYQELLKRMAILTATSKTAVVKVALDELSKSFPGVFPDGEYFG